MFRILIYIFILELLGFINAYFNQTELKDLVNTYLTRSFKPIDKTELKDIVNSTYLNRSSKPVSKFIETNPSKTEYPTLIHINPIYFLLLLVMEVGIVLVDI